jgi:hypothetical protein
MDPRAPVQSAGTPPLYRPSCTVVVGPWSAHDASAMDATTGSQVRFNDDPSVAARMGKPHEWES